MAESATQRIAAKLAARKAAPATKPDAADNEVQDEAGGEAAYEDDNANGQDEAEATEAPKKTTIAERAKAAREARAKTKAGPDEVRTPAGPTAATKAKAKPTAVQEAKNAPKAKIKSKKVASPAQLAARAAFAARSKARAATSAAEREAGDAAEQEDEAEPIQTEAELKAKQNADRKAARGQAASTPTPKKPTAGKAVVVQKPSKAAAARIAKAEKTAEKAKAKASPIRPSKASGPVPKSLPSDTKGAKAKKAPSAASVTTGGSKERVTALWGKGRTRTEIAEATGLSYAAVYFHTKGVEGTGANTRGKVFVETRFDAEGEKLPRQKTEKVSRSEAMRRSYRSGISVGDTARAFEVKYQLAYTAIKPLLVDSDD